MTEDFYDLLEIPPDASQDDVKEAYREKVRIYHPDLNDDDRAQAQFTAVKKAYDILGDPVERQAYDRLGHEDYVRKRTSGLPSPDVWKTDDESSSSTADPEPSESSTGSRSKTASSGTTGSAKAAAGAASSATGASKAAGASEAAGASNAAGAASEAGETASSTASGGAAAGATSGADATASGRGARSTAGGSPHGSSPATGAASERRSGIRTGTGSRADRFGDNPVVRWWRRQNFGWPLLWLSVLTYLAGLGHYGFENEEALTTLWTELATAGAAPAELWTVVSTDRYGLRSPVEFVVDVEPIAPPLDPVQWYGALAGAVAVAFVLLLLARVVSREDTWRRVTIDETIVAAVAIGATTTVLGGPLLAGTILMPLLFGVIVNRTHQLPGWSPSYLYVALVSVPAIALAASTVAVAILPIEFLAFVVAPIAGGLGLPFRVAVRKRFGR